jgi:hypothetical protein
VGVALSVGVGLSVSVAVAVSVGVGVSPVVVGVGVSVSVAVGVALSVGVGVGVAAVAIAVGVSVSVGVGVGVSVSVSVGVGVGVSVSVTVGVGVGVSVSVGVGVGVSVSVGVGGPPDQAAGTYVSDIRKAKTVEPTTKPERMRREVMTDPPRDEPHAARLRARRGVQCSVAAESGGLIVSSRQVQPSGRDACVGLGRNRELPLAAKQPRRSVVKKKLTPRALIAMPSSAPSMPSSGRHPSREQSAAPCAIHKPNETSASASRS